MKSTISLFASFFFATAMLFATNPGVEISVKGGDVVSSTIKWTGYKVTGKHHGSIALKSGSIQFDDGVLTGGEFVMDMQSIVNEDLDGNMKEKLEGHLKSDDFFGVEAHPTANFKITKVVPYGTAGKYKVTGDLTIKGTTNPIKFIAEVSGSDGEKTVNATLEVDRTEYNVRYGSGSFFDNLGDKTIYDEFKLEIELKVAQA